jgi:signal transduction histidine kinase
MDQKFTETQRRTLWFTHIRWLGILLILFIVLYLKFVVQFDVPLLVNLGILFLAAAINSLSTALVYFYKPFSENPVYDYLRASLDLLFITLIIHFTGGIESPLSLLYLLELVAVSIFGFTTLAFFLAAQATAFYLTSCLLEAFLVLPNYHMMDLCEGLFMSPSYILSVGFALFFTSLLLIYMISYLSRKIEEKQKRIEELTDAKLDFVNQIVHELKSPFTSILGYIDILLKGSFGEMAKEAANSLNIIKRQAERVLTMSNGLLDLARIESGKIKIEKKPASLIDNIESAAEEMKPQLDEKNLEPVQEFEPNFPLVPMDADKIHQVLINLLSNAAKFSRPNGKIFISTELLQKEVQVSVRDEGMGIDPEDLPHIFEKFYRSSKEAAAVRGTGLGLAFCKSIIEMHGGRIWAASAGRSKGAVFYFTLPL